MAKIRMQTRDMLRFAKQAGFKLRQGAGGYDNCAIGLVGAMYGYSYNQWEGEDWPRGFYPECLSYVTGIPLEDLDALESGFEGYLRGQNNRYYRVGKNLRSKVIST
jgi:hypothetical protein